MDNLDLIPFWRNNMKRSRIADTCFKLFDWSGCGSCWCIGCWNILWVRSCWCHRRLSLICYFRCRCFSKDWIFISKIPKGWWCELDFNTSVLTKITTSAVSASFFVYHWIRSALLCIAIVGSIGVKHPISVRHVDFYYSGTFVLCVGYAHVCLEITF